MPVDSLSDAFSQQKKSKIEGNQQWCEAKKEKITTVAVKCASANECHDTAKCWLMVCQRKRWLA